MYNPAYLERPYVVVLNKIDLPEVCRVAANMWVKCYLLISFFLKRDGQCIIWSVIVLFRDGHVYSRNMQNSVT